MAPELQKRRVTEIQVRMDCNGCVQKIKKTLNGINGINDLYIDLPQQKVTIIGWADPENIIKAIRRTKKIATIYSHIEPTESPSQLPEQAADATRGQGEDGPPVQAAAPEEPPKDTPPPERPPQVTALPTLTEETVSQQPQSSPEIKDEEEVHVVYPHLPHYGNKYGSGHSYVGQRDAYHRTEFLQEPSPPIYVTHSYNTYQPSPYVTEYEYVRSPKHTHYRHHSGDYYNDNGAFTSMFSDENPNACTIV